MAYGVVRTDSDFKSGGSRIGAWLYLPGGVARPPIVVMAHGFGAEKTFGLPAYATRFAEHGLAVLLFDYRNFGASEGQPRNLVSHRRQLEDWRAAISHARSLRQVDGQRVGLWGASFSGGHVLSIAADDPGIQAIVAQVPMVDVPGSLRRFGLKFVLAAAIHGAWDVLSSLLLRRPHEVPIVGGDGKFAVLGQPGCEAGYLAVVPADSRWQNRCPARVLLTSTFYQPARKAHRVTCPALVVLAEQDQIIPPLTIERMAARMPDCQVARVDADHFQPYQPPLFEQLVKIQADFFDHCLRGDAEAEPAVCRAS